MLISLFPISPVTFAANFVGGCFGASAGFSDSSCFWGVGCVWTGNSKAFWSLVVGAS